MIEIPTDEYFAGFFDGEGCISICDHSGTEYYSLVLNVAQVDRRPLYALQKRFGGSVLRKSPARGAQQEVWFWTACSSTAETCLMALEPLLVVKRRQAQNALEFCRTPRTSNRRHFFDQAKLLKRNYV